MLAPLRHLQHQPDILLRNERQIHILQADHFGLLGFVEVGALSVGRIVQIHPTDPRYARGRTNPCSSSEAPPWWSSASAAPGGRLTIF